MNENLCDFSIDDGSVEYMKVLIESEGGKGMRIFIGGGGCCKRLEMAPVDHALADDVTYERGKIVLHVEKSLVNDYSKIKIRFNENDGLFIDLI